MFGKEKCKMLKEIRAEIAKNNEIEFVTKECTHQGKCKGTCPACEAEVAYLEEQLEKRRALGKAVCVAGLSAAMVAGVVQTNQVNSKTYNMNSNTYLSDPMEQPMGALPFTPEPTEESTPEMPAGAPYIPDVIETPEPTLEPTPAGAAYIPDVTEAPKPTEIPAGMICIPNPKETPNITAIPTPTSDFYTDQPSQVVEETTNPTTEPTGSPAITEGPTGSPAITGGPTKAPTESPNVTKGPTESPAVTELPTKAPTESPNVTEGPTEAPAQSPLETQAPTKAPTETPKGTAQPSATPVPTILPTQAVSLIPSIAPNGQQQNNALSNTSSPDKLKIKKTKISKVIYKKNNRVQVAWNETPSADGYVVTLSTSSSMKKNRRTKIVSNTRRKVTFENVVENKTCYISVAAYRYDSAGEKVFGKCQKIKKIRIK